MKKIYYWLIGIVLVFIVSNPTFSDFENHLPSKDPRTHESRIKLNNYFVASVYIHNISSRSNDANASFRSTDHYLGILGNFFMIGTRHLIADHIAPIEDMVIDTGQSIITVDTAGLNIKSK